MVYESLAGNKMNFRHELHVLLILSIATSIDALGVGLSLTFLGISITIPAVTIGITTFIFSFCGVYAGYRFGSYFEHKVEFVGGIILIGIGLNILADHML